MWCGERWGGQDGDTALHHAAKLGLDAAINALLLQRPEHVNAKNKATTQRATKGLSGNQCPSFRYLIRRNPPIFLGVAYRRVLGLTV
ncbi:hypothetical protein T484DRAFT_3583540 [Baffinella frigidus]|nr:hypothetical protein T484DRAFT_3583540 [Cryptophyta sp. CCMP2293]